MTSNGTAKRMLVQFIEFATHTSESLLMNTSTCGSNNAASDKASQSSAY